jgi:RecB family endonuclease NucS
MGRADVFYFTDDSIRDGTVPNTVIELKMEKAGKQAVDQIMRYLRWFHLVLGDKIASRISIYLAAPSFVSDISLPAEHQHQVKLVKLGGGGEAQCRLNDD